MHRFTTGSRRKPRAKRARAAVPEEFRERNEAFKAAWQRAGEEGEAVYRPRRAMLGLMSAIAEVVEVGAEAIIATHTGLPDRTRLEIFDRRLVDLDQFIEKYRARRQGRPRVLE